MELRDSHRGRPCAVLGGGPSLPAQVRRLAGDELLIGVNQHALLLALDYIMFQDAAVFDLVKDHPAQRITQHRDLADIWSGIAPDFQFSGGTAVWVADFFGCAPIILCGIDEYSADRRYWHSIERCGAQVSDRRAWVRVRDHCREPTAVRAMDGPLVELFGGVE